MIDAHPAVDGEHVALERGADAVRDHRRLVAPAEIDDVAHLVGGFGKYHGVGRRVRKVGLILAVMLAHAPRGRDAIAEQCPHLLEQRGVEFAGLVQDGSSRLFEFDLAVEPHRELEAGDIEHDRGRELLVALDCAPGARPGHRLLDLPLGTHPDHLQEFSDAEVEAVFVHDDLRLHQRKSRRAPSQSRFRSRARRPRVEASSPSVSPASSSLGSSVRARFLPCSTPHWSKLFRFQMTPSANTLCSCSAMSAPSAHGVRRSRSTVLEGRFPGRALCGASGAGLPKARAALWASALATSAPCSVDDSSFRPITMKSTGMRWVPWCNSW